MKSILARVRNLISQSFTARSDFEIYTDGSSRNGWGSWAYVISKRGRFLREATARVRKANSNTMEFQAAIEALKSLPEKTRSILYSDSRILVDTMKKKQGPRVHQHQIDQLVQLCEIRQVTWKWVKAHHGIKFNERCDELCRQSIDSVHL